MRAIRLALMVSVAVSATALLDGTALAQSGPGAEPTPGMGMGPGMRSGRGPSAQWGTDFTPGWSMMTRAERNEHRERMRSMKTYEECKTYIDQHHEQMAARAKEKGGKPLPQPRRDACARLKP